MSKSSKDGLTYQDAGVNIERANALVEAIKPLAARTRRPEVITGIGGFGAMFAIPKGYDEPILISGTDGVGTKLKLAIECNQLENIGIDLVAMCVNDIICHGAEPLFFLDYYATGKLNNDSALKIIQGIVKGCELAGCSLVGGETAELPGLYTDDDFDLAGFSVGVVERAKLIDGCKIKPSDCLIALGSSGPHANGYSLIRKVVETQSIALGNKLTGTSLQDILLAPTRIYAATISELIKSTPVHGIAHITGGGITENLARILPPECRAVIDTNTWLWPQIFTWLQEQGGISSPNMQQAFNLGVGMICVVPTNQREQALNIVNAAGELAWQIGEITSVASNKQDRVQFV